MEISIANRQRRIGVRSSRAKIVASSVMQGERACYDEISIVFLGDKPMRRLNRVFTGRDEPTDTLAFELTPEMGPRTGAQTGAQIGAKKGGRTGARKLVLGIKLGEVIVCVDRAIVQSKRYRVSLEKEVARLLIHGLLHLCGFEDGTQHDRVRMRKRENFYITSLDEPISSLIVSEREGSKSRSSKGRGA